jgi:hypothetical protein
MAKARLIRYYKGRQGGLTLEMVMWQLPAGSRGHPHGIKYRFYLGRDGRNIVRYDNEVGKGDHRHLGPEETQEPYSFVDMEKLFEDFRKECERLGWEWTS